MIYGTDLASATLCVEIAIRRVGFRARFSKNGRPGEVKCGLGEFPTGRQGLGCIGMDPYGPGDPKNVIISLFPPIGGQFGPIFPLFGGSPLGHAYCPFKGPWPIAPLKGHGLLPL